MKNYHKFYFILFALGLIFSCVERKTKNVEIIMVNFDDVNSSYVSFLKNELSAKFQVDSISILTQKLPESVHYPPRNRYRADKLIRYLRENYKSDKIIGLTEKDISTTSRNHKDWGIMGLAFCPGKSCVVSTFRTFRGANSEKHKKERLKKVVFHEFGHTLGLPHCDNEKSCLMRDAGGKVRTVDETLDFCLECKTQIISYLK